MFNRNRCLQKVAAVVSITLVAGCSVFSDGSEDTGGPIVVGTTSAPSTLDPAASWDQSWELFRNIYQTLLSYSDGAAAPQPDAAESCEFTESNTVYTCKLREGLTFSNGHKLDAQAVKYSIDRIKTIDVSTGPAGLLDGLDQVQVVNEREVAFHLNKPNATFPFVLATPGMSIVDPAEYPKDGLRKDGRVLGSGPYNLESYQEGKQAVLVGNKRYKGSAKRRNDAVTIRYYQDSRALADDLRHKKVDLTFRGLAADDVISFQRYDDKDIDVIDGPSSEIEYLVFNPKDPWVAKPAVRRAVAQLINRGEIVHRVYKDTVQPLYSMVPAGLTGHSTAFFDDFGDPSVSKAAKILADGGINQKVPLTLWYTTDRYGSATAKEFQEIKRQLEASGLFTVTLHGRPWNTYVTGYQKGEYPVFGRGWSPDFPDADNFIAPFVGKQNAVGTPYASPTITDDLLPTSRRESDRAKVVKEFRQAQTILAKDARLLPLWQGKQYLAASADISGAERSLDPSAIMMMWELFRKTSW
ncbi:ABC transporter substrate-binding protein [Streptomyces cellostaticus]|uniref:ABC transporter substrate-binding protein n=1 Tax=Streptomyces cellostaticus TaxID=67285 RepID=UPI002025DD08|nr:ABC transporter substrate-binding protein [Streptomyces cellostaticus]